MIEILFPMLQIGIHFCRPSPCSSPMALHSLQVFAKALGSQSVSFWIGVSQLSRACEPPCNVNSWLSIGWPAIRARQEPERVQGVFVVDNALNGLCQPSERFLTLRLVERNSEAKIIQ